ncbi:MAG: hypothetical protein AAF567_07615 [Actinomycetota bacterium]
MAFFIVLTVLIIGGCAAASWWWATSRLAATESSAVYDIEEAADFCATRLPDEVNARLDRNQLQWLLGLHLAYLRRAGIATYGGVDDVAMDAAGSDETVVAHEDEAVDFVLQQVEASADDTPVVDVVVVVDLSNQYLASIGAFGPSVQLEWEDDGDEPGHPEPGPNDDSAPEG